MMPVTTPPAPRACATRLALVFGFTLAVFTWLVIYLDSYLATDWNAVRLIPSFMWTHGTTPYPGPGEAPITTWIYGPATLLFFTPATLAPSAFSALLVAFFINLGLTLLPLLYVLRVIRTNEGRLTHLWALLLALSLWPACNFVYQQADNTAIAFGLLSVGLLSGREAPGRRGLWLLALAGGLALWSKPTELGPVLGQIVVLGLRGGLSAAARHVMRLAIAGGLCGLVFILTFGAEGIAYNAFIIPSRIPWDNLGLKMISYIYPPYVLAYVVLPLLVVFSRWKRFLFEPGSAQVACWFFMLSLPFNIAGFATIGGNVNSLHGCTYLIPWLAFACARRSFWLPPALITLALAIQYLPFASKTFSLTASHRSLVQAEKLAQACPGQIYFPWNPLITFYSEGKFYHSDDGVLTRALIGEIINHRVLYGGLPADFNWIAYPGRIRRTHLESLLPPTMAYYHFNGWTLVSANGLLPSAFSPIPASGTPSQATP